MDKPVIPSNESSRLEMLQSLDILDSQAEERFDRLTRMARHMFNVPIALVSLVDEDRQWFKSCFGVNATETAREISFCGHAILDDEVFIIPDSLQDKRFVDNPLVVDEPHIRFYAGCPLNVNGCRIGTLCIIDQVPRDFKDKDVNALRDLATMVERELDAVQLATFDELTGISNRRGFVSLAQHCLKFSVRNKFPVTMVFMDLDLFKAINDTYGHEEGDKALVAFTTLMKASVRDSDVIGRLGGDEFVILLNNSNKQQSEIIIAKFKDALQTFNQQSNASYDIKFSYGVVEFELEKHGSIETLLAQADSLMYEAKNANR